MCREVKCKTCGKPGWAGCGAHVEQVLAHVPKANRCACPRPTGGGLGSAIKRILKL
jgi:Na+-translocating ferredoxin:NAD+ oxidoreductase RNF subunit RnfB